MAVRGLAQHLSVPVINMPLPVCDVCVYLHRVFASCVCVEAVSACVCVFVSVSMSVALRRARL